MTELEIFDKHGRFQMPTPEQIAALDPEGRERCEVIAAADSELKQIAADLAAAETRVRDLAAEQIELEKYKAKNFPGQTAMQAVRQFIATERAKR